MTYLDIIFTLGLIWIIILKLQLIKTIYRVAAHSGFRSHPAAYSDSYSYVVANIIHYFSYFSIKRRILQSHHHDCRNIRMLNQETPRVSTENLRPFIPHILNELEKILSQL